MSPWTVGVPIVVHNFFSFVYFCDCKCTQMWFFLFIQYLGTDKKKPELQSLVIFLFNSFSSVCIYIVTYYSNFAVWLDVIVIYESSKSCCVLAAINTVKRNYLMYLFILFYSSGILLNIAEVSIAR